MALMEKVSQACKVITAETGIGQEEEEEGGGGGGGGGGGERRW